MNKLFCFILLFFISLPISLYIESFDRDDIIRYLWILAIIIQHACIFILYLINRTSVQKIMRTTIVIGDVVICFLIYVYFVCVIAAAGDKGMIYSIKSIVPAVKSCQSRNGFPLFRRKEADRTEKNTEKRMDSAADNVLK